MKYWSETEKPQNSPVIKQNVVKLKLKIDKGSIEWPVDCLFSIKKIYIPRGLIKIPTAFRAFFAIFERVYEALK